MADYFAFIRYVLSTMGEGWAVGSYLPSANDSLSDGFAPLHGKNVGSQLDQLFDYGTPGSSAHRTFFDRSTTGRCSGAALVGSALVPTGRGSCPSHEWLS